MSRFVEKAIRENEPLLKEISEKIWLNPELSFEERYAHDLLASTLEKFGFVVKKHYILPTAFRAEFSEGKGGPTVAVICEYDALPQIGHGCGHNLIAEIGLAVGLAVKTSMENEPSICGKVVVLGTPAEEGGGGKIKLIEKGAFKDIDAALMAHPQMYNRLYPLILDLARVTIIYRTKEGVDAWESPNAVDAAVACYNNIALFRRCMNSRWRISGIIRRSTLEETELCFSFRAPTRREILIIREKLKTCIRAAAETTECICDCDFHENNNDEYRGMIVNKRLAETFAKHAHANGIVFRDGDPRICDSAVSTDMGNVSHVVPSIHPEYCIGAAPHVNHTPGFTLAAGSPAAQRPTLTIAESLAQTVVELLSDSELLTKVKAEFYSNPNRNTSVPLRNIGE